MNARSFLLVSLGLAACGRGPEIVVVNGGTAPTSGDCDIGSLVLRGETVGAIEAVEQCGAGTFVATTEGAAFAYWRTATAADFTGPAVAGPTSLSIPDPSPLRGDGAERGLSSGGAERGLSSGGQERGLASGSDQRGLSSGADDRQLASGGDERGLSSGADQASLSSGAGERGLSSGGTSAALGSGGAERGGLRLEKRVHPSHVATGQVAVYDLLLTSALDASVVELLVVDHVPHTLEVTEAPAGAAIQPMPDGGTRIVIVDATPLEARGRRSYRIRVRAR